MKNFKEFLEEKDPCWKGYRQLGTKKKNGKEVPNCIPEEVDISEAESKLPPHLQKLIKDKNLDKVVMQTAKQAKHTVKDVTPKGYGPTKEEIEIGDGFIIELKNLDIETTVIGIEEDGVLLSIDEYAAMRLDEAEYQGRDVPLNKPMAGDVKKSKVFVKGPSGNVVKVNFGDKNMTIKKHIPERRKSFRARHNCDNPGPKHKARFWSCKMW